jgi:uncharacterized protein (DUF433 family)
MNIQRLNSAGTRGATFSVAEAAFATGVDVKTIQQAIDRREIVAMRSRGARRVGMPELLYLSLRQSTAPALSRPGRAALYKALREGSSDTETSQPPDIDLASGVVRITPRLIVERLRVKLAALERSATLVTIDPDIRGGDPILRGTRVPVYTLSAMKRQGASDAELLEDFPSLTTESLDAALTYAATHPRRGRPKRAPWQRAPKRPGNGTRRR